MSQAIITLLTDLIVYIIYCVCVDVNNDGVVDWQDFSCALEVRILKLEL